VLLTEIGDVGLAGFEDAQPEQAERRDQGKSLKLLESRAKVSSASDLQAAPPNCR
jgi:hypothetical protein